MKFNRCFLKQPIYKIPGVQSYLHPFVLLITFDRQHQSTWFWYHSVANVWEINPEKYPAKSWILWITVPVKVIFPLYKGGFLGYDQKFILRTIFLGFLSMLNPISRWKFRKKLIQGRFWTDSEAHSSTVKVRLRTENRELREPSALRTEFLQ